MKGNIEWNGKKYSVDLDQPFDLSLPMRSGDHNPNAFGIGKPLFEPFRAGSFVGSVALGGSTNCENLFFNPHGNGTHTECVGHISKEKITINQSLKQFFFVADLITVALKEKEGDLVLDTDAVKRNFTAGPEALVIRSLPNETGKMEQIYSGTNPAYLEAELCSWLREQGVKHLLIDLPSVDREEDQGALAAHRAFWNYPDAPRRDATITEMIYASPHIPDGRYLLNIQIASLETDASPSKPVLYTLKQEV